MSGAQKPPQAFISYAIESEEHRAWVKRLAIQLSIDGTKIILDQWELYPGDNLPKFMERAIVESDFVILICTPAYKRKAERVDSGVGYERNIITAQLMSGEDTRKYIPLLRTGEWGDSAPSWLRGSLYLDFNAENPAEASGYSELIRTLHGRREVAPAVGLYPFDQTIDSTMPVRGKARSADAEPQSSTPRPGAFTSVDLEWPYLWLEQFEADPSDPALVEMARSWLLRSPTGGDAWVRILLALLDASPTDSMLLEIGKQWLVSESSNDPKWIYIWTALIRIQPRDPVLLAIGRSTIGRSGLQ